MSLDQLNLKIVFGGGLELLFSNQRSHNISIPSRVNSKLYNGETTTTEEQNIKSFSRRPGILVLINDTDWELEGEGDYVLNDGDEIVLISTLHGG
ncbi:hypothetical protein Clacol_008868 [Clathrus columnatus]|uniref:Ubiquitin-related modifier 1 n=1 Tax=Clathrus columnatus TaxID=1419009 RepID=A0AAV5ALG2_9AGAM|nr:hypothetical protein Clacol_008868 [Clathrus columnatus]